jgi:hypothetical protein
MHLKSAPMEILLDRAQVALRPHNSKRVIDGALFKPFPEKSGMLVELRGALAFSRNVPHVLSK